MLKIGSRVNLLIKEESGHVYTLSNREILNKVLVPTCSGNIQMYLIKMNDSGYYTRWVSEKHLKLYKKPVYIFKEQDPFDLFYKKDKLKNIKYLKRLKFRLILSLLFCFKDSFIKKFKTQYGMYSSSSKNIQGLELDRNMFNLDYSKRVKLHLLDIKILNKTIKSIRNELE